MAGIKALNRRFPHAWNVIAPIEEQMREHVWRQVYEDIQQQDTKPNGWRSEKPWDYVIKHTAYGREDPAPRDKWWARHLEALITPGQMGQLPLNAGTLHIPNAPKLQNLPSQAAAAQVRPDQQPAPPGPGQGGRGNRNRNNLNRDAGGGRGGGKGRGNQRGDKGTPSLPALQDGCPICGQAGHNADSCPSLFAEANKQQQREEPRKEKRKRGNGNTPPAQGGGGTRRRKGNKGAQIPK